MSVESRLREASSELDAVLSRVPVPPLAESPRTSGPLVASVVAPAAVILLVVSLLLWIDEPSNVATTVGTTTVTTEAVTTAPRTSASGTTSPREMTGTIEVIDPSLARPDLLAGLAFDPDSLGQEYRLDAVDDPDSVRSWFQPIVWSDEDDWEWTIVGQVAGFQMPVVVAKSKADTVVCAGRESEPLSCAGEGFLALAGGENSPAVWFVPASTAVVGFAEHDNFAWQIPSRGAVAFPRFHLTGTATLTAYDRDGQVIARVAFDRLEETNSSFDMLPQPPMVDLMRALLDRGVPAIANTNVIDHNAPVQAILGVADSLQVEFTHVDRSTSYAMIVGDGVRGVAIWSQNSAQLTLPLEDALTSEDQGEYQTVDMGDRLIVSRGVAIENIVDLWNEVFGDG
ncbi:MAG: hypothetical protein WD651_10230 [Acidimicrobiia bacterium]